MLELQAVSTYYGKIRALHEISLHVRQGEVVAILGANGAGKTTMLRTISGLLRSQRGHIRFKGREIERWSPDRIVRLGLGHCPEGRQLFPEMSVYENLEMGAYTRGDDPLPDLERIFNLFPTLRERRDQRAGSLSGGEQQMLAIGRTLMSNPQFILFDEPSLGLAPLLVQEVARSIRSLNAADRTVLLVEQDVQVAFTIAQRGYVLESGRIVLEGSMSELARSDRVRQAYLGE